MSDYDLFRLTTRAFEHLIQAIALRIVSKGVSIFGDGPDGGREATFDGKVSYPDPENSWEGFGVIQAKFKQKTEGTTRDGDWACKALDDELNAWHSSTRTGPRPRYFIFATNVVLSPGSSAHATGAKDRAASIIRGHAKAVGIADFRIWDQDQVRGFLDAESDIRRTFAAWTTPGDVLSKLIDLLEAPKRPDFYATIGTLLQKHFREDHDARLASIGTEADRQTPLSQVFIDLPVSHQFRGIADHDDHEGKSIGFAQTLMHLADTPKNGDFRPNLSPLGSTRVRRSSERIVLVGGPGQGKSTLGQLVCQVYRAIFLVDRHDRLSEEVHAGIIDFLERLRASGFELPSVRRFPIRVELRKFARALADIPEVNSVLSWISHEVRLQTDRDVSPNDLRDWLAHWPWLIVFDGLDEVPPTSNREQVLRAIQNFFIDAADVQADIVVVATTRPQGYNDDFDSKYHNHWFLTPLRPAMARTYAELLISRRHRGNDGYARELMTRIDRALNSDQTARLMQSPLQVTIMATLVERIGEPPRDRWRLFREYYDTIYRREVASGIPSSAVLRDHQPVIDNLHYEIGFELQVASEVRGGTDARIPTERLREMASRMYRADGWSTEDTDRMVDLIVTTALHRLVFLVPVQEGYIGFELRSLQEFMAAEYIAQGPDDQFGPRLSHIARAAHWRNVLCFVAGRTLNHKRHMIDVVLHLCHQLNEAGDSPVDAKVLTGARLAVDLLEDGFARMQPRMLQAMSRDALRLLSVPLDDIHIRLADTCDAKSWGVFEEEIRRGVAIQDARVAATAWNVLFRIVQRGEPWALQLLDELFPTKCSEIEAILQSVDLGAIGSEHLATKIVSMSHTLPLPTIALNHLRRRPRGRAHLAAVALFDCAGAADESSLWPLARTLAKHGAARMWRNERDGGLTAKANILSGSFTWRGIRGLRPEFTIDFGPVPDSMELHHEWIVLKEAHRFVLTPNRSTLSSVLKIGSSVDRPWYPPIGLVPWPLGAAIRHLNGLTCGDSQEAICKFIDRVADGELGDSVDWQHAECRWQSGELSEADMMGEWPVDMPFGTDIGARGVPLTGQLMLDLDMSIGPNGAQALHDILFHARSADIRACVLQKVIEMYVARPDLSLPNWLVNPDPSAPPWNGLMCGRWFDISQLSLLAMRTENPVAWAKLFDSIERYSRGTDRSDIPATIAQIRSLHRICRASPSSFGARRVLLSQIVDALRSGSLNEQAGNVLRITINELLEEIDWVSDPFAHVVLQIVQGGITDEARARRLGEQAAASESRRGHWLGPHVAWMAEYFLPDSARLAFLLAYDDTVRQRKARREFAYNVLVRAADRRKSGVALPSVRSALGLTP